MNNITLTIKNNVVQNIIYILEEHHDQLCQTRERYREYTNEEFLAANIEKCEKYLNALKSSVYDARGQK